MKRTINIELTLAEAYAILRERFKQGDETVVVRITDLGERGVMQNVTFPMPAEALEAIKAGHMLQAIHAVRDTYAMDIVQAKNYVQFYKDINPNL